MPQPDEGYVCPYSDDAQQNVIKPCADLHSDGKCKFLSYASITGPHAPPYPVKKQQLLDLGYIEMTIPELPGFVLHCVDHFPRQHAVTGDADQDRAYRVLMQLPTKIIVLVCRLAPEVLATRAREHREWSQEADAALNAVTPKATSAAPIGEMHQLVCAQCGVTTHQAQPKAPPWPSAADIKAPSEACSVCGADPTKHEGMAAVARRTRLLDGKRYCWTCAGQLPREVIDRNGYGHDLLPDEGT